MSHIYGAMGEVALDDVSARLVGMLAANMTRVIDLFREWDLNGDGMISPKEFRRAMMSLKLQCTRKEIDQLFVTFDPDGSNTIDFRELHRELRKAKARAASAGPPSSHRGPILPTTPRAYRSDDGAPLGADELQRLGAEMQAEGRLLEAMQAYDRALALVRREQSAESTEVLMLSRQVADLANSLAMQYLQQDGFAACLHLLRKAETLCGRHKPLHAITLNNVACYYRRRGQPKMALSFLQRALEIEARCKAPHKPADTHLNLCAVLSQLGRHPEAVTHARAALQLLKLELGIRGPLPADGVLTGGAGEAPPAERMAVLAIAYHNLGVEQENLHQLPKAMDSYGHACAVAERHLGPEHPIAVTLSAAYDHARRLAAREAARQSRPASAPVSTPQRGPRPFSASEVSARKARMSASVRAHIEKMQVVRSPTYKKPLPKPHQRRAAKTELVIKEGEDVVGALKKWLTKNAARVMTLFVKWDTDGNGMVDKKEFREACRQLGLESISTSDLDALFASFDHDGGGTVDFKELNRMLRKQAQIAEKLRPGRGSIVGFAPGTGGSLPIRPQSAAY